MDNKIAICALSTEREREIKKYSNIDADWRFIKANKDVAVRINEQIQQAINDGYDYIAVCDGYTVPLFKDEVAYDCLVAMGQNVPLKTLERNRFDPKTISRLEPCFVALTSEYWIKIGGLLRKTGSVINNLKAIVRHSGLAFSIYNSIPRLGTDFVEESYPSTKDYVALVPRVKESSVKKETSKSETEPLSVEEPEVQVEPEVQKTEKKTVRRTIKKKDPKK